MLDKLADLIMDCGESVHNLLVKSMKPAYERGDTLIRESRVYAGIAGSACVLLAAVASVVFLGHTLLMCAIGGVAKMFDNK